MRYLLIPFLTFMLVGCAVPVKRSFPDAPDDLKTSCPDLTLIQPTKKLSDVVMVVTNNYAQYQECQLKVDSWIEWYDKQKDIFNNVK